uniref:AMP-binding_C domain-containing protein n=1 Tax=Heterorhabditis bacteriophora TaxID=37862 RepID=A0A1I7WSN4_HETBA
MFSRLLYILNESGQTVLEPFVSGELYLKAETVMKGYNHEDDNEGVIDDQGWIRTGDVLYFDSEGFYYVVDRVKDIIKVNGMQVSPSELEDVILTHPHVAEVGVIGIEKENCGQVPKAFIVLKEGVNREKAPQEIDVFIRDTYFTNLERVAHFKYLRGGVEVRDELPKTSNGKIKRISLKE